MMENIAGLGAQSVGGETPVLSRALVVAVEQIGVTIAIPGRELQLCDHLAGSVPVTLTEGDEVLVWLPATASERGVVVGRIRSGSPRPSAVDAPEELVLEAKHSLTLRVGDGSITIRDDGKILIKGKDLVSHAQRVNRIKGGSVSIN